MGTPVERTADLTVGIATCDRPEALARCLDALLGAATLPAEIIVVDQSADDRTRAAVAARARRVPIIYVRQPRAGLSASRNAVVARASRPLIAVTDDDCVPDPAWVEALASAFADSGATAAVTGRVLPLGPHQPGLFAVSARTGGERIDYRGRAAPWVVGTGGNFAVRREWLDRVGAYDERLGAGSPGRAAEDADLIYRLLRAGAMIRYEPAAVVYHERQSLARRLASSAGYGFGVGAFGGIWLRRRDLFAARVVAAWGASQARALTRALAARDWVTVRQRSLNLGGLARGLVYGLRQGDRGRTSAASTHAASSQ
jgi:GT2 family glycosyltransferase